mmetsp:Transcript_957/g.1947  ORF Transcript_957/g.1947 Transcript_957/m.1947 type:complete len:93 (-) Transcript_957:265-543(-)|eukprot:CAMPEP_0201865420 /NCGR_PEP_ID=MMETSP0902-20130614/307_1 /ASSEMBLY_ACC=CAM_ASM_000551 /TAXON_ID=420261 /ORGANISM="Thalassiosira antarctica, Strain CCMP982" /LENGTH=92 /DNA_ID=CAMNT_0048390161 /DNA_START=84 /DNA_END=362 /DNA_ORIENTATION=+
MGVFEDTEDDNGHSHDFCKMMATKVHSESEFPVECKQYNDAVSLLKRHSSAKIYAGMSPGDACDARRAKDEGHLNNAQIKRRMTTKKNGRFY